MRTKDFFFSQQNTVHRSLDGKVSNIVGPKDYTPFNFTIENINRLTPQQMVVVEQAVHRHDMLMDSVEALLAYVDKGKYTKCPICMSNPHELDCGYMLGKELMGEEDDNNGG